MNHEDIVLSWPGPTIKRTIKRENYQSWIQTALVQMIKQDPKMREGEKMRFKKISYVPLSSECLLGGRLWPNLLHTLLHLTLSPVRKII